MLRVIRVGGLDIGFVGHVQMLRWHRSSDGKEEGLNIVSHGGLPFDLLHVEVDGASS
jgi:hypothetical protein